MIILIAISVITITAVSFGCYVSKTKFNGRLSTLVSPNIEKVDATSMFVEFNRIEELKKNLSQAQKNLKKLDIPAPQAINSYDDSKSSLNKLSRFFEQHSLATVGTEQIILSILPTSQVGESIYSLTQLLPPDLATTASHICHFPNSITPITFDNIASKRTKITFIAPNMKKEMGFVTAHLSSLFKMSHYSYVKDDVYDPHIPEDKYGNFLDVEWEFVDGNLTEEWVVKRLLGYYKKCVTDEKSYLTMAFCDMQADRNIAAASYLPYEFHKIIRDEETHKVNYEHTIPLLIYQSENEELVRSSQASAPMCENMFSFGSMRESYDPSIRQRINEGKRINYIYSKDDDYVYMTSSQDVLDTLWKKSYLEQVSNIYCANHIGVKLRSVGINEKDLLRGEKIPDKLIDQMAAVEHNRWNMEKLLMGYDPIEASRRQRLKAMEPLKESDAFRTEIEKLKKLKKNQYVHHCIAPFGELLEEYKKYDYLIVRNLTDAC